MQNTGYRKQLGFTLIELMITIVVLAILLFVGTSLTRAWVDQSHVDGALAGIKNATYQARSAAIRNTNNQESSLAAASVCIDKTHQEIRVIRVAKDNTDACSTSDGNSPDQNYILQKIPYASNVFFKVNNTEFYCLSFNSNGMLVAASSASATCNSNLNLTVTVEKNNESANIQIN
ncbi:pilus assembly FimT family protein [Acinetobacter sp. DSM 11652]|uniref:pilus assembly FimT family protein n=1 Tax=Acinetobacter sp. DSM 11652 TaxID=346222 RepID=UPI0008BEC6C7|nr:prepilin-type N-terminal cleavage/methylation domain-containing protein [Acinetobacter sp. DSM 11652]SEM00236.1 prepilin-type N-terminal cleavage/methylation domain-containing protein [Acinetobacter sp. DSM 11652]